MGNYINSKNIKKIEDFEGRFSSMLYNTVKKVAQKASEGGKKWEIDPTLINYNLCCGDTRSCAQTSITNVFVDDDDEVRVTFDTNRTVEICNLTYRDICGLLKTQNSLIKKEDVEKLENMGNKLSKILLSFLREIINEASPFSLIIGVDSLNLQEPLCNNLYEVSFKEINTIFINDNDDKIMVGLCNNEELSADSLTCYDLLQIIQEVA